MNHTPGAIDTHAHVYPAAYLDLLEDGGVDPATTRIARDIGADSTAADITTRLAWMDRAGVATQVLAATPQVPFSPEPGHAARCARWINDEYLRLVDEHPGRFAAYASLPLPHVEASLAELERVGTAAGVVGVTVPTLLPDGGSLVGSRLDPVWQALSEAGAVVNVHPTGSGACSPMITEHGLAWVNGAPVEDATTLLQWLAADMPRRFPGIRLHVAHLGGDLPFLAQRVQDNYEDWGSFPASPAESLRDVWVDAANFHEPSLLMAVDTYGPQRVMAGSDHPYFQEDKYVRAMEYVRTSRLAPQQRDAVLRDNALALYGRALPR
ncbi:amidohydrolase family protein [Kytococcus sedentarius]|uniref:amidohydrolase family protein n=1 Tax=Kytococcus sedentarius TaxID=1276 RepID=UPI00194FDD16|nr:amidohydrolase family protein [Kytococcus sedentarius]QRO86795.1 amidohydrolase [Kytococcus sedentarius]